MARLSTITLVCCLLAVTVGSAQAEEPMPEKDQPDYARRGGYLAAGVSYGNVIGDVSGVAAVPVDVKGNIGFALRGGARLDDHFGLEVQFDYIRRTDVASLDHALENWVLTLNGRVPLLTGRVQPYLVGGIGIAHNEVDTLDFAGTDLAFRVGGGVEYYLAEDIALDLGVSYVLPTAPSEDFDLLIIGASVVARF